MSVKPEHARSEMIRKQIRGSGLLLTGNFLSLSLGFCSQLLIARYLSVTAYGLWAYALSIVGLCGGFSRFGLPDAVSRFIPLYHEEKDYRRLFGTILLGGAAVAVGGAAIVAAFQLVPQRWIGPRNGPMWNLLLIVIFLVPVDALDQLLMALFACFAKPRAIFFRRHVLSPGLKLAVVLLLIFHRNSVFVLAYGYLFASALGVILYSYLLWSHLRREGLLDRFRWNQLRVPTREVFKFAFPGLTSDLVTVLYQSAAPLVLGMFYPVDAVAFYRVVVPAAVLNSTVMTAFTLLYTPAAARLLAKHDMQGINVLYWRTALWVGVLTFPIFAATFCFSRTVTLFLYGARYESSASVLAILAVGYYVNASLGFNGQTLKVLGKIRYLIVTNVVIAGVNIGLCLLLIPRYGIVGAALATSATMILHNMIKQIGLSIHAGTKLIERQYVPVFLLTGCSALGLWLYQQLRPTNIYGAVALALIVSLALLLHARNSLNLAETFPESLKVPLLRKFVA